jgi:hypothetical protein
MKVSAPPKIIKTSILFAKFIISDKIFMHARHVEAYSCAVA